MSSSDEEPQEPQRPVLHRLLHALGEAVLGIAFGGASFVGLFELFCLRPYRCADFKGLPYLIVSFIAALVIVGVFFSLCRRFRHRLKARFKLDAIVGVVTVVVWAWYLFRSL